MGFFFRVDFGCVFEDLEFFQGRKVSFYYVGVKVVVPSSQEVVFL